MLTFNVLLAIAKSAPQLPGWSLSGSRERAIEALLATTPKEQWAHLIEGDRELPCNEAGCSRYARVTQFKVGGVWWYAGFERQAVAMAVADLA